MHSTAQHSTAQHSTAQHPCRGNVLFLILIAVALFAALSYAVTKSSSGGGSNISDENAKLAASVIVQHANNFRTGLQRFLLMNPYDYDNANFDVKSDSLITKFDPFGCTQDRCNLMHPGGGGITLPLLPLDYSLPSFTQWYGSYETSGGVAWRLYKQKVKDIGSDKPDLILVIYGLKHKICTEINDKMNAISNAGSYRGWGEPDSNLSGDAVVDSGGSPVWCLDRGNDDGIYGSYFHMVVLPR